MFFILGIAHADLLVVQIGPKKAIFRGFTRFFSELLDCNKLLILIESPNIFHWKSTTTKKKVGVVLGAKFGLN